MSTMLHPLSWFIQRQGKVIERNGRNFKVPNKVGGAEYCHELQESGFKFSDVKPTVHIAGATCTSCEG